MPERLQRGESAPVAPGPRTPGPVFPPRRQAVSTRGPHSAAAVGPLTALADLAGTRAIRVADIALTWSNLAEPVELLYGQWCRIGMPGVGRPLEDGPSAVGVAGVDDPLIGLPLPVDAPLAALVIVGYALREAREIFGR